jgi:hypothetical protein
MVSIVFNKQEQAVIEELCAEQDLSQTALIRQCLRLYQVVHLRTKKGDELAFKNRATGAVTTLVMLNGPMLNPDFQSPDRNPS